KSVAPVPTLTRRSALSYLHTLTVNEQRTRNRSLTLSYLISPILHNPDCPPSVLEPPSFIPIPPSTPFPFSTLMHSQLSTTHLFNPTLGLLTH
ncbi:hypothetical protein ACTXT7_017602, partial [Hymenolepis weldensis]